MENANGQDFEFLTTLTQNLSDDGTENEQGKTRTEQALQFMYDHHLTMSHLANWVKEN